MAMESPTWSLLAAAPAVTALVPQARIHKGYAGDSPTVPYIVIEEITATPENYVAGRPGIDNFRSTVRVLADDTAECRQIGAAVRDAMEVVAAQQFAEGPYREKDTGLWSHLSDWSHWTHR